MECTYCTHVLFIALHNLPFIHPITHMDTQDADLTIRSNLGSNKPCNYWMKCSEMLLIQMLKGKYHRIIIQLNPSNQWQSVYWPLPVLNRMHAEKMVQTPTTPRPHPHGEWQMNEHIQRISCHSGSSPSFNILQPCETQKNNINFVC